MTIAVEGYTPTGDGDGGSRYDAVGPGLFLDAGHPDGAGPRDHRRRIVAGGAMVCVINEAFARRFFAGRNPIGLHLTPPTPTSAHLRGRRRGA